MHSAFRIWDPVLNETSIEFLGFTGSEMKYSTLNKRWEIMDSFNKETLAIMNGTSKIPFGVNQWYFTQSNCTDEGMDYRTLHFHKDVGQPGIFCCNDGTCFTSENVFDGAKHCPTGEDEDDYELIEVPKNYEKMVPPASIFVDFIIEKILGINYHESTFDVSFGINITWFDRELNFHYLKNNENENIIPKEEKEKIWVPDINFAYVRKSFHDGEEKLYIKKITSSKMSADMTFVNVSEVCSGKHNPIIHLSEHNMRFFCEFDGITKFPFGSETCSFDFYLEGRANKLTNIERTLNYPSQTSIGQYKIIDWDIKNWKIKVGSKNAIRITISLTKSPLSTIMMTYIPVLLMNIINQATNYITGDSKYDLIITVNITSMVVLATIYMTVSMSLPNTPDIKPVEVWLFFSIAFPFLVIITNVLMQVKLYHYTNYY